jgi:hypothetical protein
MFKIYTKKRKIIFRMSECYVYKSKSIAKLVTEMRWEKNNQESYGEEYLMLNTKDIPLVVLNAITRAALAHVPTMRIDPCFVDLSNTNCDIDPYSTEHELGKLPIRTNPDLFLFEDEILPEEQRAPSWKPRFEADQSIVEQLGHGIDGRPHYPKISTYYETMPPLPDPRTTLMFYLKVECTWNEQKQALENEYITGAHLEWIPLGDQKERLTAARALPLPHPKAVICRLSWGHKMNRILYAVKGTGFEHAKWRGASSWFDENNGFHIKSLDGIPASKYYTDACRVISQRFHQLALDCRL